MRLTSPYGYVVLFFAALILFALGWFARRVVEWVNRGDQAVACGPVDQSATVPLPDGSTGMPTWTPPIAKHGWRMPDNRPYPPPPPVNLDAYAADLHRWTAPRAKTLGDVEPVGYTNVAGLLDGDGDAYRPVSGDGHLVDDEDDGRDGALYASEHDVARGQAPVVPAMPETVVYFDPHEAAGAAFQRYLDPPPEPHPDPNPWRAVPWLPVPVVAVAVLVHMGLVRYEPHGRHHRTGRHDKARPTFGPSTRGRGVRVADCAGWLPSGGG